jgi:hypothetical protein
MILIVASSIVYHIGQTDKPLTFAVEHVFEFLSIEIASDGFVLRFTTQVRHNIIELCVLATVGCESVPRYGVFLVNEVNFARKTRSTD